MRSLTLLSRSVGKAAGKKPEGRCTAIAVVPAGIIGTNDEELVFLASERQLRDGGVEIQILRAVPADDTDEKPVSCDMVELGMEQRGHRSRSCI